MKPYHHTFQHAMSLMPGPAKDQYDVLMRHGTLEVGIYAPRGIDDQTPHSRDEVYVVMKGTGEFQNGPDRVPFGPGDVLFVPARQEHRFEKFSEDFAAWVFFYGPEGGEKV